MKTLKSLPVLVLLMAVSPVFATPNFLTLPFNDSNVKLQNAPRYFDGTEHWGAGYAFDFVKGEIDKSSTWQAFTVHAAASGVAIRSYQTGYGDFVLIKHDVVDAMGQPYFTLYAHLQDIVERIPNRSRHDTSYTSWARVESGEQLGIAGNSGKVVCASSSASCIHLHFEVFRGGYFQNPIDPYDISDSVSKFGREAYAPNVRPGCGTNHLWTTCPPHLAANNFATHRLTASGPIWARSDRPGLPLPIPSRLGETLTLYWDIDATVDPIDFPTEATQVRWDSVRGFGIRTSTEDLYFVPFSNTFGVYENEQALPPRAYFVSAFEALSGLAVNMRLIPKPTTSFEAMADINPEPLDQWATTDSATFNAGYSIISMDNCGGEGGQCSSISAWVTTLSFQAIPR